MNWRIERGYMPGIYNVYNDKGNPVAVDCTRDRATLIAAAPDLLEALEFIMAQPGLCWHIDKRRREKARAAITKAKG